jgi:hypothetical protein
MNPASSRHLHRVPDLHEEAPVSPVGPPPKKPRPRVAHARSAARATGPAVRVTVRHTGYGVAGLWRAGGALWQWTTAAELSQHLATRPEVVTVERERRRKIVLWTAAASTAAAVYLAYLSVYLVGAILLVLLFGASVVERRLRRSDAGEDAGRKSIGQHPSGKAVRGAVAAAKLGAFEQMRVVGPVTRDGAAWLAQVELPPGITSAQAVKRQPALASALGVDLAQLAVDPVRGHGGRITVWCADSDPLAGPSIPSPLAGRTTPFDVWAEKVAVGVDVRGRPVAFALPERSILTGGEPGSGKSVGSNNVLCSVSLDPHVPLWLADGKGGADLMDYEPLAVRFLADPDPRALLEMIGDAQDDMSDRYRKLRAVGEKKISRDIAADLGIYLTVFHIDELQFFAASDLGKEIVNGLWDLVSRGRGAGWVFSAATQRPSGDVVPTKLRDILSIRWALRCTTPEASDTILGRGWAGQGYSAATLDSTQRGAGFLLAEGSTPVAMRTYLIGDREATALTKRAYKLREEAGTLPQSDARPAVRLLKAVLSTFDGEEKVSTEQLLGVLTTQHLMAAGWDATRLADELRPLGVRPADQWIEGRNHRGYRRAEVMRALDRA